MKELDRCGICPRKCRVNRNEGKFGYCNSGKNAEVASICIHQGEEPPITGKKGICNVFFSGCNLSCVYCQNYQISRKDHLPGILYSIEELADKIVGYLETGIHAVGFVSPSHYAVHVKAIILQLHELGFQPVTVYNTNCYDNIQTIKDLEGLIDVYLPDFKYIDREIAKKYSYVPDYPEVAKEVLREMYRQKGSTFIEDDQGQVVTGMIIRHLVLPGQSKDSVRILEWIAEELSYAVCISLMSQYYPTHNVEHHPELGRKITVEEYEEVRTAMEKLGFYKGWAQDFESSSHYQPDFSKSHPFEN